MVVVVAWSEGRRPLGAVLHSSNEPSELSQWPRGHDDSTINIVLVYRDSADAGRYDAEWPEANHAGAGRRRSAYRLPQQSSSDCHSPSRTQLQPRLHQGCLSEASRGGGWRPGLPKPPPVPSKKKLQGNTTYLQHSHCTLNCTQSFNGQETPWIEWNRSACVAIQFDATNLMLQIHRSDTYSIDAVIDRFTTMQHGKLTF